MYINSAMPIEEVLQCCNDSEDKKVLIASDWTIPAISTRMERQVLCKWKSQYVTWTQYLELPSDGYKLQYEEVKFSGGYYRTFKEALDCFKMRIAKRGIKINKCTKLYYDLLLWESKQDEQMYNSHANAIKLDGVH